MIINKLTKEDWATLSEKAHLVVFNEDKPVDLERIDFALVASTDDGILMGYVTCRELDGQSVYWQYGGSFPGTRGTIGSFKVYQAFIRWCKDHYIRIFTYIENTNVAMLKMALKVGYKICGIRQFKSHTLVEHILEFPNE